MAQIPRIYTQQDLTLGQSIELESQASQHISRVLRLTVGDQVRLFNGTQGDVMTNISGASKKATELSVESQICPQQTIALNSHLGQVVSKGERMEYTIQKATELGVCQITPLWSERCEVKLKGERLEKKLEQWRKIAISACEQSGRNNIPQINAPMQFSDWCTQQQQENNRRCFILHPDTHQECKTLAEYDHTDQVSILIGPEGGFSQDEVTQARTMQFNYLTLGPRVLRTETASVAVLSVMQYLWGDF